MDASSQKQARRHGRTRRAGHGLARFEVRGLDADRDLIRSLARRLAEPGAEGIALRKAVTAAVHDRSSAGDGEPPKRGGIYAALRNSPLVGSGIDLTKTRHPGRDIDL